jgi:hypothetical protein
MLDGLHHVWRAAAILAAGDVRLTERLKEARAPLLLALVRPEEWPPDLLSIARSIERVIGQRGGTDPLEVMGSDFARQMAEDLLSLAVDVQALFAGRRCRESAALPAGITSGEVCWQPAQA